MKKLIASLILILATTVQADYLEPLLGLGITANTVKIRVASGGCTNKSSFEVKKITDTLSQSLQLNFVRVSADTCEAGNSDAYYPNGVVLTYRFEELGIRRGQRIYVGNPFSL